jgi:MFS family permease
MAQIHKTRWTIWALAVVFYFYEYILRVFPSVIVPELRDKFHANASVLGLISAFYLYAYAPMQLPTGFLIDRFSARRLLAFACMVCGLSAIWFAVSNTLWMILMSRFLMGFGSAFAFLGCVYVSTHWFTEKKAALLVPLVNTFGMLGPFFGQGPLEFFANRFGYELTLLALGLLGILLAIFLFFAIRNEPKSMQKMATNRPSFFKIFKNSKDVFKHTQTWVNASVGLFSYLTTVAFAGFWAVPFLQKAYALDKNVAGFAASMIFIGWMAGGPLWGYFISRFNVKKKTSIILGCLLAACFTATIIYVPRLNLFFVFICMFLIGFFTAAQVFTFSLAVAHNRHEAKGTTIAFLNFTTFIGGSIVLTLIGYMLVYFWDGTTVNKIPIYNVSTYQQVFIGFPISYLVAAFLGLFLKEKKITTILSH